MKNFLALTASICALNASPLVAQTTELDGDHAVDGALCAGDGCSSVVNFLGHALIVRTNTTDQNGIYFNDTNLTTGFSMRDWSIRANETFEDLFSIRDADVGQNVFSIQPDAGSNALYISTGGNIGLGTALPQTELHLVDGFSTALRLEQNTAQNQQAVRWDVSASNAGLQMVDNVANSTPLRIENAAPQGSIFVKSDGFVGLGTQSPEGKLHTKGTGTQLAYFESDNGGAVQVRFRTDSENRRFLAVDNDNQVKTQMQFRDNSIKFFGQTVAQEWLSVSAAGITTAGPTCNPGPCDATFDPDVFTVPPIQERAAYMWENQHLFGVGPTKPGEPINLTEKMGGVIHELEVAHIYIEQLHETVTQQTEKLTQQDRLIAQQSDQMAMLFARLEALESQ